METLLEDLADEHGRNPITEPMRLRRYVNGQHHDLVSRGTLHVVDEDDIYIVTKGGKRTQLGDRHLIGIGTEHLEIKGPTGRFLKVEDFMETRRKAHRDHVHEKGKRDAKYYADGFKKPVLITIDLTKAERKDHKRGHPDIDTEETYLALIGGEFFVGTFSEQHYGYNFNDGWGASGHQFDPPGENLSRWQGLWRLEEAN